MIKCNLIFKVIFFCIFWFNFSCNKSVSDNGSGTTNPPVTDPPIDPAVDPATANTIGFFLDDWQAKSFTTPSYTDAAMPAGAAQVTVNVNASDIVTKIPGSVFGQNANIWMTQMVTEGSLINNLTNLHPNIIRFPGGSLSDVFFWNADTILRLPMRLLC